MKKNWKRIVAFLTAVSCLAGSSMPALATQTEKVPRVVFENEEKESPDLYVTKKVESASEEYPAPEGKEAVFTFTLKLDGEPAEKMEYRVFDADGAEVFQKTNPLIKALMPKFVENPYKTDRDGTFTLEAGQTALFEGVGTGKAYEVTEKAKDGYEQILPAGGAPAVGTVAAKGARAEFTNLYLPEEAGDKTRLEVRKTLSFPSGYAAPETPAFSFRLTLGGKAYAGESYTVEDTETGKELRTGTTDGEGTFTLRGGEKAVFAEIEIPKGMKALDYRVEELPFEGEDAALWRCTGESVREGATTSPVTPVVFNNASASFAVSKRMEDGSKPEKAFNFLLTDGNRTVWGGAKYYLYNTTGELAEAALQETAADGTFALKAGQTAVFAGIAPGTRYNVSEQGDPDYVQALPLSAEGYTDKTVTDGVETLTFINREAEKQRTLNVTKNVENTREDAPIDQEDFRFILYKETETAGEYAPAEGVVYRIQTGEGEYTYATESGGVFTLKAGETARFTDIAVGNYKVEETDLGAEYRVKPEDGEETGSAEKTAEVKNDGTPVNLVFTNLYTVKRLDLHITKKNKEGETLAGAEFKLYRDALLEEEAKADTYTSDENGAVTITGLREGTYYLKETKSPEGYRIPANAVKFEVVKENGSMQVFVDGKECAAKDGDDGDDAVSENYLVLHEEEDNEAYITIYNKHSIALPMTGGTGILWSLAAGFACVILLLWMGRRKNGKRRAGMNGAGTAEGNEE